MIICLTTQFAHAVSPDHPWVAQYKMGFNWGCAYQILEKQFSYSPNYTNNAKIRLEIAWNSRFHESMRGLPQSWQKEAYNVFMEGYYRGLYTTCNPIRYVPPKPGGRILY